MKNIGESLELKGRAIFELRDRNGKLKYRDVIENQIPTVGYDLVAQLLAGAGGTKITHVTIGDDNTAFASNQSDLIGTSYRVAGAYSFTPGTVIFKMTATWGIDEPIAGTFTIKEAGLFNAAVAGDMFSRLVRADLNKLADDILTIRYEVTMSNP